MFDRYTRRPAVEAGDRGDVGGPPAALGSLGLAEGVLIGLARDAGLIRRAGRSPRLPLTRPPCRRAPGLGRRDQLCRLEPVEEAPSRMLLMKQVQMPLPVGLAEEKRRFDRRRAAGDTKPQLKPVIGSTTRTPSSKSLR
jgi:hypothetical protein